MTQYIIKNNQFVAGYVLWQFANSEEIPADDRKKILTICENSIDIEKDKEKIDMYLQALGKDYYDLIVHDQQLVVSESATDYELVTILAEKKLMTKRKKRTKQINIL